jgi:hypothetical protein
MRTTNIPSVLNANSVVRKSTADITYYIETTGDPGNDGLTIGTAVRQWDDLLNKIPYKIDHTILVAFGAGAFDPVGIENYTCSSVGKLTARGTMGASTLATGTANGTFDGGTNFVASDSGQSWTSGDLVGRYVKVGGDYYVIKKNDATSLEICTRNFGGFDTKSYTIEEPTTIITSGTYAPLLFANNFRAGAVAGDGLVVEQFRLENTNQAYGVAVESADHTHFKAIQVIDPYPFGVSAFRSNYLRLSDMYVENPFWGHYNIGNLDQVRPYGLVGVGGGAGNEFAGIELGYINNIDGISGFIDGNGNGPGVHFRSCKSVNVLYNKLECNNNAGAGIKMENSHMVNTGYGDYIGTNNGTYGMEIDRGSRGLIKTGVSITGASGDCLLGDTVHSWPDWVNDGDIISDPAFNCSIRRMDS